MVASKKQIQSKNGEKPLTKYMKKKIAKENLSKYVSTDSGSIIINKAIKFKQISPAEKYLDFEMVGKIMDDLFLQAIGEGFDINVVGNEKTSEFFAYNKFAYYVNIHIFEDYIMVIIVYDRDIRDQDVSKSKDKRITIKQRRAMEFLETKSGEEVVKKVKEDKKLMGDE